MENLSNQTLENVIRTGTQQAQGQVQTNVDITRSTALFIYTLTMNLKFPDVTDLSSINYNVCRSIAEFSIGSTRAFDDVWNELVARQRSLARQTRAA